MLIEKTILSLDYCQEKYIDKESYALYNYLCCLGVIEMKWSLQELKKHKETQIVLDELFDLADSIKQREPDILAIEPLEVKGFLEVNTADYFVHVTVQGKMTLPSSRSLLPVEIPVDLTIDEIYMTSEQLSTKPEHISDEDILILDSDQIDLARAVEDHLLLSIPLQVLTEEEKEETELPKGKDWEIISEDSFEERKQQQEKNTIDPRLAKLSELFQENGEDK
ncbi:hypothetical protein CBF30_03865 [Vagococcus entomophilus]|uniref:Nucleic acid-binding protein n=2 Tax=Vagococcus entomophilus TaxID=1160095 RepID=A0A430AJV8_9ENTE|nr:hypothetical protein CBF30_03865 [Vagococcus entomophilus]